MNKTFARTCKMPKFVFILLSNVQRRLSRPEKAFPGALLVGLRAPTPKPCAIVLPAGPPCDSVEYFKTEPIWFFKSIEVIFNHHRRTSTFLTHTRITVSKIVKIEAKNEGTNGDLYFYCTYRVNLKIILTMISLFSLFCMINYYDLG
jgi:hypothetical protein